MNFQAKDISQILVGNEQQSQQYIIESSQLHNLQNQQNSMQKTIQIGDQIQGQFINDSSQVLSKSDKNQEQNQNNYQKSDHILQSELIIPAGTHLRQTSSFNGSSDGNTYPRTPQFQQQFPQFNSNDSQFQQNYSSQQMVLSAPTIQIKNQDQWNKWTYKWDNNNKKQINPKKNNYLSQNQMCKLSKKVKSFCKNIHQLTQIQVDEIQKQKYTVLMKQVYKRQNKQVFYKYIKDFLQQIIKQQESRLFFATYFSGLPQKIKDFFTRLFSLIPNSQENKQYMSRAVSQFKLNQVPDICLSVNKQIIVIFRALYPTVYIQDLIKPSIKLYELILQNFFKKSKHPFTEIIIQDEIIDVSHPRNILNILLYLNQTYQQSMQKIFYIYCTQLIKNNQEKVLIKMLKEQQTFQICQVSKSILQEIIQNQALQILKSSFDQIDKVTKLFQILKTIKSTSSLQKVKYLQQTLNLIKQFNQSQLTFNIDLLFSLYQSQNIFIFLSSIIRQNTCENLIKIKLPQIYKNLNLLVFNTKLIYYNHELKDLCEILCQKYFQSKYYQKAFSIIAPIISVIKKGFIAKILFKYFNGKMINRLTRRIFDKDMFISVFHQFFNQKNKNKQIKQSQIKRDQFDFIHETTYLKQCPELIFSQIYQSVILSNRLDQIKYIFYCDFQLANQLCTYQIISKKQWNNFISKMSKYIPQNQIKKATQKILKFNSRIKIFDQQTQQSNYLMQQNSIYWNNSSFLNSHIKNISQQNNKNNTILIKSLQQFALNQTSNAVYSNPTKKKSTINRSKSNQDTKNQNILYNEEQNDDDIVNNSEKQFKNVLKILKLQKNKQNIYKILAQIYQSKQNDMEVFIKALQVIDRQKFKIYHYQQIRLILSLNLQFDLKQLLPFQFFFIEDSNESFYIIKQKRLQSGLRLHNFYVIYIIIDILIKKGQEVAILILQKLIYANDDQKLHQVVKKILTIAQLKQQNKQKLIKLAEYKKCQSIKNTLIQYKNKSIVQSKTVKLR